MVKNIFIFMVVGSATLLSLNYLFPKHVSTPVVTHPPVTFVQPVEVKPQAPSSYTISHPFPDHYLTYQELVSQLKEWNKEAPEITEFGTYGNTSKGTPCYYLRVGTVGKPKELIFAGIHGDERLSIAAITGMIGRYLKEFGKDEDVTWLIKNRDIYFVPALSPDTYMSQRWVENQDPNRSLPCPNKPNANPPSNIKLIMEFDKKHQFKGVISNHTFGRLLMCPGLGPKEKRQSIYDLANEMSKINNYTVTTLSSNGGGNGYEADWFYAQGACAMLIEWADGPTHNMPYSKVLPELDRNYKAFLLFFRKAADIKITPQ